MTKYSVENVTLRYWLEGDSVGNPHYIQERTLVKGIGIHWGSGGLPPRKTFGGHIL